MILNVTIRFVMIPISLLPSEHHLLIIYFYVNRRCEDSAPLNYPLGEEGQREMSIQSVPCSAQVLPGLSQRIQRQAAFCLLDMQPQLT